MLKKEGIKHNVLNAKYHEQEAEIVADAGVHGAVTIATNMAGRGTDIKLDEDARAAGGLKIIGTERHESRRIDNQLRGRSGRQGDPVNQDFIFHWKMIFFVCSVRTVLWELLMRWVLQTGNSWSIRCFPMR